ncbi:MAG: peptidoglycan-binding protein [Clostridia bacterium]|nr:peptidoglycan-binding protein [Clostridia bacterium]
MKKLRIGALITAVILLLSLCTTSLAAYATLRYGQNGAAVKTMQTALNKLGYKTGGTDGKYGPATRTAVRAFQKANGLKVDGVAGNQTLTLLYKKAGGAQSTGTTHTPTGGNTSSSYFGGNYATLKKGATGSRVTLLQKALNKLGYSCGSADGKFGTGTRNAVIRFQRANGLTADGAAGVNTLKRIEAKLAGTTASSPAPTPSTGTTTNTGSYKAPTRVLRPGYTGEDVKTVQRRLKELGYYKGAIDGKYGSGTVAAMKAFQKAKGLTVDGKGGPQTYKKLFPQQSSNTSTTGDPFPAKGNNLLAVARSQLGYVGSNTPSNLTGANVTRDGYWTKYGEYTGHNGESWCASFIAWCGMKAGNSRIKSTDIASPIHLCTNYNTPGAVVYFNDLTDLQRQNHPYLEVTGIKTARSKVTPAAGDLIFFRWKNAPATTTFSHVGVVSKVSGGKVYYIDGCGAGNVVAERSKSLTDTTIAAYCKVSGAFSVGQ